MNKDDLLSKLPTTIQQTAALEVIEYIHALMKSGKDRVEIILDILELKTDILAQDEEEG